MRFSPSCQCCGCVADADHICVCGCLTPIPKTLFIGDSNGTHSLVGGLSGGIGGVWTCTAINLPGTTVYCPTGLGGTTCTSSVETWSYFYKLTFRCAPGGGDPAGWKLELITRITSCSGVQYPMFSACLVGSPNLSTPAFLPFDCDFSLLSFTLPTSFIGGATPMPGGGGTVNVVP